MQNRQIDGRFDRRLFGVARANHQFLVCLGAMLFVVVCAPSGAIAKPEMLPDIRRIVERGELRVAMIKNDLPPFVMTQKSGKMSGLDPSLARAIAKNLRVKVRFIRSAETFDDVVDQVADGTADVGLSGLSATATRAKFVHFTRPYLRQSLALLLHRVNGMKFAASCPSLQEIYKLVEDPDKVGVVKKSAYFDRILEAVPNAKPRAFRDESEAIRATLRGDVVGMLDSEVFVNWTLEKSPAYRIQLRSCSIKSEPDRVAIAVRPGAFGLLHYLNTFLEDRSASFSAKQVVDQRGEWQF